MSKAYSGDLRERVAARILTGHSRRDASRHFGVSPSFAIKLAQRVAATGSIAPSRMGRPTGSGKLAPYLDRLIGWVEAQSDITMPELAAKLLEATGVVAHPASLSRALLGVGFSVKKTLLATECGRADVRDARQVWRTKRQPRMCQEPHRL